MPITKEEKQNIIAEFGKGSQDTGSSQVQVALLTKNISKLTEHCQKNPKDFSSRRGLLQMVSDRRGHLFTNSPRLPWHHQPLYWDEFEGSGTAQAGVLHRHRGASRDLGAWWHESRAEIPLRPDRRRSL